MLIGKNMWNDSVTSGLTKRTFHHRNFDFYEDVPDNLFLSLERSASRYGNKTCIYDDSENGKTYAQLLEDCLKYADYLYEEKGVQKQTRVGLMMYNSYEFCVAFYACIRLGAVVIPLPTKYRKEEILSLCGKSDLQCVICDRQFRDWFASAAVPAAEDPHGFSFADTAGIPQEIPTGEAEDTALILFTSGTTDQCKGVVIKNYSAMHAVAVYRKIFRITEKDSTIIPVPIYYVTGLIALMGLFLDAGGTVYLHKFFDAGRVLATAQEKRITFLHASPTVFSFLLKEKEHYSDLPYLRMLACGSSHMPVEKIRMLHEWLPHTEFRPVYGLTETASPATVFPADAAVHACIGSSGIPVPGLLLKILNSNGTEAAANETGEIRLSGTVVLNSYYRQETGLIRDGWLDTGDIGYVNEDGYLFIVDRKKDMINRGGEKICSYDVENAVCQIPGILEAAVVGIPDPVYGEVAAAAVVAEPQSALDESAIKKILGRQLAGYQVPARILFLSEIPVTRNLKPDKQAVRKLFTDTQEVT